MSIGLNIFQEIFLVAFSILYGIMLQTYFGYNPFPWGKILQKTKKITGLDEQRIKQIRKRVLTSIVVLNILPFLYAVVILWMLGWKIFNYEFWTYKAFIMIFLSFWGGLAVFGFQRLYGKIAMTYEKIFWKNKLDIKKNLIEEILQKIDFKKEDEEKYENNKPDRYAFLIPLIFYTCVPIITLWISSFHPICGIGSWLAIMVFVLIWLIDD